MAFPVVEATNETATVSTSSHVVNLPSGIVAGDLILIVGNAGTVVISFNALAGWTELLDEGIANGMVVWARQADGTEGATVTFTSSAAGRLAAIAYRISAAELLATQAPQLSTVATGSSVSPNATTCTPTGGAKDYLWISFFGRGGEELDDDTWTSAAPANYTNLLQKACGTAGTNQGGMVAAAQRNLNAASEDAGAFTVATGAWRAYTIAVHPSTAGVTSTKAGSLTSSTVGAGADVFTAADTGSLTPGGSNSAADVFTAFETGSLLTQALSSGVAIKEGAAVTKAGFLSPGVLLAGADVFTASETAALVIAAFLSGADIAEHSETGSLTTGGLLAGVDISTFAEAGSLTTQAFLSGVAVKVTSGLYAKTGVLLAGTVFAGGDAHTAARLGTVSPSAALSGADVFIATEAGSLLAEAFLAGVGSIPLAVVCASLVVVDQAGNTVLIVDAAGDGVSVANQSGDGLVIVDTVC